MGLLDPAARGARYRTNVKGGLTQKRYIVTAEDADGGTGAFEITKPMWQSAHQVAINAQYDEYQAAGSTRHNLEMGGGGNTPTEDDDGQRRWGRGAFEAEDPAYVSWVSYDGRDRSVLRTMAGLTTLHAGTQPVADSSLSPEGSRFAKYGARNWGIQGHPQNPAMEPTLGSFKDAGELGEVNRHRVEEAHPTGLDVAPALAHAADRMLDKRAAAFKIQKAEGAKQPGVQRTLF